MPFEVTVVFEATDLEVVLDNLPGDSMRAWDIKVEMSKRHPTVGAVATYELYYREGESEHKLKARDDVKPDATHFPSPVTLYAKPVAGACGVGACV